MITFWSGIGGDGPDGPLIFCTCAGIRDQGSRRTAYQRLWGWPTLAAARAGHQAVTAWIGEIAAFLAGHADQLPAADPALPGVTTMTMTEPGMPCLAQAAGSARQAVRDYAALAVAAGM